MLKDESIVCTIFPLFLKDFESVSVFHAKSPGKKTLVKKVEPISVSYWFRMKHFEFFQEKFERIL